MSEFKNSNVLITGAASGIGKLMAERAAKEGATLVLWDINKEGLDAMAASLRSGGTTVHAYQCDLSSRNAIYETASRVLEECGTVDILINNAGVVSGKTFLDVSDQQIELTFKVNTLALFWITRAFLPAMIKQNRGHIVTIASASAIVAPPKLVDYGSSKFAALGFDDALRLEFKRLKLPIKTTVICPYYIDTGMFAGVKTRFPFLLPILKPEYVVKRIINAIRSNRRRVIMPRFVMVAYPVRLLPMCIFDWLMDFFGITRSMDHFTGRTGR